MMVGHFVGWVFANIAIPFLAPIVFIKAIQAVHLDLKDEAKERIRITYLVREGQYAMGSIAIATTAMFELFTSDHLLVRADGAALLISLIILTIFNTLIFVLGVAFGGPPVPDAVQVGITVRQWMKTYRLGAASFVLGLSVSVCAFWAHWISYEVDHPPMHSAQNADNHSPTTQASPASPPKESR